MVGGAASLGRVLIVDDHPLVREFCSRVMSCHGMEVLEAEDGPQAIEIYEATQPDVVLLDLTMPRMDGLTTLRELRRIDSDARVVMISGNRQIDVVKQAVALGAQDYVVKPFISGRLVAAVDRLLGPPVDGQPVAGGTA